MSQNGQAHDENLGLNAVRFSKSISDHIWALDIKGVNYGDKYLLFGGISVTFFKLLMLLYL